MADDIQTALFQLIYQGPEDDSARTLQKIKGVFLADLEFPIEDIQRILSQAPALVRSADKESELRRAESLLKSAGARVLIVRPSDLETPQTEDTSLVTVVPAEQHDQSPTVTKDDEEFTFELELDDETTPTLPQKKEEKPPKVYHLELNEAEDGPLFPPDDNKGVLTSSPQLNPDEGQEPSPLLSLLTDEEKDHLTNSAQSNSNRETPNTDSKEINAIHETKDAGALFGELKLDNDPPLRSEETPLAATALDTTPNDLAISMIEEEPEVPQSQGAKPAAVDSKLTLAEGESTGPRAAAIQPQPAPQATIHIAQTQEPAAKKAAAPAPLESLQPPAPPPPSASRHAPEIPETDQAQSPAEPPEPFMRRASKSRRIPLDTVVAILVGAAIIACANIYFFMSLSSESGSITPVADGDIQELLQDEAEQNAALSQALSGQSAQQITGELIRDTYSLWAQFEFHNDRPGAGTVRITTSPPPDLTKEEIVQGVAPRPWLRRVEISIGQWTSRDDGTLVAESPIYAYIQQGKKQFRASGKGWVVYHPNTADDVENLTVAASSTSERPQAAQNLEFEMQDEGTFRFSFFSGLRIQVPNVPK